MLMISVKPLKQESHGGMEREHLLLSGDRQFLSKPWTMAALGYGGLRRGEVGTVGFAWVESFCSST